MSSSGAYVSYDGNRKQNREDLLDFITLLSPNENPIFDRLEKTKAQNVYHEYDYYTISRSAGNVAAIEGADYTFSALATPTRNVNYVEEIVQPYKVSITQTLINRVGGQELPFRRLEAMTKWKNAFEYELINASGASGTCNAARIMKGIITSMSSNTSASGQSVTEKSLNSYIQNVWNNVTDGTYLAYMDMRLKRDISSNFVTSVVKNAEATDFRTYSTKIDVYQSDVAKDVLLFGHRDLTGSNKMIIMQERAFRIAMLENPRDMDVPAVGGWMGGVVRGSGTLEALYPTAGIVVTNLTPTN